MKEIVPKLIEARRLAKKEVVEWIYSHQLIEPDEDSITRFEPFYQIEKRELEDYAVGNKKER